MKKKRRKKFKIKYIIMLGLAIYLGSIFIRQEFEINKIQAKIQEKEKQKETLDEYIEDNTKKAEYLNKISSSKDPIKYIESLDNEEQIKEYESIIEYIENMAREELFMVKPNEIIYIDKKKVNNIFKDNP